MKHRTERVITEGNNFIILKGIIEDKSVYCQVKLFSD